VLRATEEWCLSRLGVHYGMSPSGMSLRGLRYPDDEEDRARPQSPQDLVRGDRCHCSAMTSARVWPR